jgi:hypothetical protein
MSMATARNEDSSDHALSATVASMVRLHYTLQLTGTHDVTFAVEPFAYWT